MKSISTINLQLILSKFYLKNFKISKFIWKSIIIILFEKSLTFINNHEEKNKIFDKLKK